MNGQLKDKNNNNVFNYNNADNITYKDMKLSDYLDMLEMKMKSVIYNNLNYKLYGWFADEQIATTNTYQVFDVHGGSFNGRKNTNQNPYTFDNDKKCITIKNANTDLLYTKISFVSQCNSNSAGNKYIRIRVLRNGTEVGSQYSSVYNPGSSNSATCHVATLGIYLRNDDEIYFECNGTQNDNFSKNSYFIESENKFNSLNIL